ncbi:Putative ribonuclease H protein At1g65750 [Linum perenne]
MNYPNDLWVRVLVSKYLKQTSNGYVLARKIGFSSVLRGILKVWPHVTDGLQWSINNGRNTHFWTARWVDGGIVLIDHALNILRVDTSLRVADVCSATGDWNIDFLSSVLPSDVVMQVIGMCTPRDSLGDDALIWGFEPKGSFSIRSAYLMLSGNDGVASDHSWNRLWKWNGPNKIKHFLWLASHDRLMTNVERNRRHLTNQVICSRCSLHDESLQHVLFECQFALQVWRAVLPEAVRAKEEHGDFFNWWRFMLADDKQCIKFGNTAWLLWKARNKFIFDKVVQSVLSIAEQCVYWMNLVLLSWKTIQLGREAPDGSRLAHTGSTAIGGLIRDERGVLAQAFCANIGNCSITRAELKAIVEGMKVAWSLGIRKLSIQSDSRAAIEILMSDSRSSHQHRALVEEFHNLRLRNWEISLLHVYREANYAADYLANLGRSFDFGFQSFMYPDSRLAYWLRYDLLGIAKPRVVSLIN